MQRREDSLKDLQEFHTLPYPAISSWSTLLYPRVVAQPFSATSSICHTILFPLCYIFNTITGPCIPTSPLAAAVSQ